MGDLAAHRARDKSAAGSLNLTPFLTPSSSFIVVRVAAETRTYSCESLGIVASVAI